MSVSKYKREAFKKITSLFDEAVERLQREGYRFSLSDTSRASFFISFNPSDESFGLVLKDPSGSLAIPVDVSRSSCSPRFYLIDTQYYTRVDYKNKFVWSSLNTTFSESSNTFYRACRDLYFKYPLSKTPYDSVTVGETLEIHNGYLQSHTKELILYLN